MGGGAGVGDLGGNGGFGGGGGHGSSGTTGGSGGFGGGGGGGTAGAAGGNGGFGGGGGTASVAGTPGTGGFGGGNGTNGGGPGGGGAGLGGAIFVTQGGSLTLAGTLTVNGNAVTAGAAGGAAATAGSAFGAGLFLQGNGTVTFAPGAGATQTVSNAIADQTGSGGAGNYASGGPACTPGAPTPCGAYAGAGSYGLIKSGAGTLVLSSANSYSGGTQLNGGTLSVSSDANLGTAGTTLTFNGGVLQVTGTAFTSTSRPVTLGATGGTFDIANAANTFSIGQAVTGAGGLSKIGPGTLTLSGVNTYSGGTQLNGGTLSVSSDANLGTAGTTLTFDGGALQVTGTAFTSTSRPVALGATGGTFDIVNAANTFSIGQAVTGAGGLSKIGPGTLTLSGANTYSGGTTIGAGTLVGSATSFGTGPIANGAALVLNQPTDAAFANAISGSGTVTKQGAGNLVLAGTNTYAGGTTIAAGTLTGSAASFGTGGVLDNAALVFDQAAAGTFAGAISGSGTVAKQGAGLLALTGASTYTGATTVQAGTLQVNGSLASVVTVAGGTLGGTGTVGGIVAQGGATVAPGNSIGTLNVAGNVGFAAGSAYQVEVNAAGQGDRIAATGSATLSGGTVQVLAANGNYAAQTRYTILTAAAGVTGRFAAATSNLAFLLPSLAYDATNVFLTLSQAAGPAGTPIQFSSVAFTPNQLSTATAVQALGPGNPIFDAVLSRSAAEARLAFDRLSNEIAASTVTAGFEVAQIIRDAILGRLRAGSGAGVPGTASVPAAFAADLPGGRRPESAPVPFTVLDPRVFALWGQGFGAFGATGQDGNAGRLTRDTGGFVLGADATLDGTTRFGLAAGYTTTSLDVRSRLSSGELTSGFGALYAGTSLGPLQLRFGGVYAGSSADTRRTILFPGFAGTARGRFGGETGQIFGEAGYRVPLGPVTLEPFAGLAGVFIGRDRYTETGGAAATTVFGRSYDLGAATAGIRAEAALAADWLTLRGLVGYRRAFGDVVPRALVAFAGTAASFGVAGVPVDRDAVVAEAGIDWRIAPDVKVGLGYAGQAGPRAYDHGVRGNFLWQF